MQYFILVKDRLKEVPKDDYPACRGIEKDKFFHLIFEFYYEEVEIKMPAFGKMIDIAQMCHETLCDIGILYEEFYSRKEFTNADRVTCQTHTGSDFPPNITISFESTIIKVGDVEVTTNGEYYFTRGEYYKSLEQALDVAANDE